MTRACIYARRSTDEHQVESLDTQLDNARRYCAARGWPVVLELTDTASRAEFSPTRRPGFAAVRSAALAGEYTVLVTRDDSRLGGDMLRVPAFALELHEADVTIHFYSTGEDLQLDSETERLVAVVRGFSSEGERRKISSRTREHLERKARRGLVAGGAVFGYRNEPAPDGQGRVRVVDAAQAAVVREIYELYAAGSGLRAICKALNARGVAPPRAGRRGVATWGPSAIQPMLRRVLYVGRVEWGRSHKTYKGGTKVRVDRHAHELVVVDAPHLRIVPAEIWTAVQARFRPANVQRDIKPENTRRGGRPASYLLSGILRCGACDGPLTVLNGRDSYEPIKVYTCCRRRDRGGVACSSSLRRDVRAIDAAVLEWVRREVLTEGVLVEVLAEVRRRVAERSDLLRGEVAELAPRGARLRRELDRLAELVLEAPDAVRPTLYEQMAARQAELAAVDDRLRAARTIPSALDLEIRRIEADARRRVTDLVEAGARDPATARAFIAELFPGGLRADAVETPEGRRMRLSGEADVGVALIGKGASPAGFEPA